MFRKNYTDQDIISAAKESSSCAQLLIKLNLKPVGGNYATIKRKIQKLNIDCSHWSGQSWSKNKQLKDWDDYKCVTRLKKHLIKELGHKCEKCLISVWYDNPVPIEIHHIDGDRTNNSFENLQLLCPNCHACTINWRGRKNNRQEKIDKQNQRSKIIKDDDCFKKRNKKLLQHNNTNVSSTRYSPVTKIDWPDKIELEKLVSAQSVQSLAKSLGVSDNSVRNRCKKYGIDLSQVSLWAKKHGDCSSKWRK